jgi:hypothetical protein
VLFKTLRWSFLFTIIGLAIAFLYDGVTGVTVTAILIVLEVSLSFDNAVVNAKVLNRMSEFWVRSSSPSASSSPSSACGCCSRSSWSS